MESKVQQMLEFLERNKLRASYKDVADFLRIPRAALAMLLESRPPEACWIVNEETGKPSGYAESECHPDLRTHDVIDGQADLRLKMKLDRTATPKPQTRRRRAAKKSQLTAAS